MKLLLTARADVNARESEDDETAVMMATHCAQSEAVKVLLAAGATLPESNDAGAGGGDAVSGGERR